MIGEFELPTFQVYLLLGSRTLKSEYHILTISFGLYLNP